MEPEISGISWVKMVARNMEGGGCSIVTNVKFRDENTKF